MPSCLVLDRPISQPPQNQGVLECQILEARNMPSLDLLGLPPDLFVEVFLSLSLVRACPLSNLAAYLAPSFARTFHLYTCVCTKVRLSSWNVWAKVSHPQIKSEVFVCTLLYLLRGLCFLLSAGNLARANEKNQHPIQNDGSEVGRNSVYPNLLP